MLEYAKARGLPAHCLLTKSDKLGRGEQARTLKAVRAELGDVASVQLYSGDTKIGVDEARKVVASWLQL
jgi:GTP-binding protein